MLSSRRRHTIFDCDWSSDVCSSDLLYVMTSEYGAASQLEKIEMLDYADLIVLNKSEKRGAEDSLRDVRKQWRRNHPGQGQLPDAQLPEFPTVASRFNDPGVNRSSAEHTAELQSQSNL